MELKLKVTAEDMLKGKFSDTLRTLSAYEREAELDVSDDRDWTAGAVLERLQSVRKALLSDLIDLSQDIQAIRFEKSNP
jgi:hypothetical protein